MVLFLIIESTIPPTQIRSTARTELPNYFQNHHRRIRPAPERSTKYGRPPTNLAVPGFSNQNRNMVHTYYTPNCASLLYAPVLSVRPFAKANRRRSFNNAPSPSPVLRFRKFEQARRKKLVLTFNGNAPSVVPTVRKNVPHRCGSPGSSKERSTTHL